MPFQSEKQRKYLWANEPGIARDWTDTYGSGIAKALGGRIPFAEAGAVGKLTAVEISELQTMIQTYPKTKVAEDAQRKLDINAGKAVEKKSRSWFEKILGFNEAEGSIPTEKDKIALGDIPQRREYLNDLAQIGEGADYIAPTQEELAAGINLGDLTKEVWTGGKGLKGVDEIGYKNYHGDGKSLDSLMNYREHYNIQNPKQKESWSTEPLDALARWTSTIRNIFKGNPVSAGLGIARNFIGENMFDRRNSAAYRPATSSAGGYNTSQLNKMNALGGYYSNPARQQRQMEARQTNILNRAAQGKDEYGKVKAAVGNVGLLGPNYQSDGSGGISYTGPEPTQSQTDAGATTRSDDSWSSSPFRKGGLASLWQR